MTDHDIDKTLTERGKNAPRLTPAIVKANIASTEIVKFKTASGQILRWAVINTLCGFSVTGRPSASVCAANDDEEVGTEVATKNAMSELWPLMGYALAERLHAVQGKTPIGQLPADAPVHPLFAAAPQPPATNEFVAPGCEPFAAIGTLLAQQHSPEAVKARHEASQA